MELASVFTSHFVGLTHARFISLNFVSNSLMQSEIGEANTRIFIFDGFENRLMGISGLDI